MGKNSKKIIEKLIDGAICANECTGALQQISLDPEEVKRFHEQFTKDEK